MRCEPSIRSSLCRRGDGSGGAGGDINTGVVVGSSVFVSEMTRTSGSPTSVAASDSDIMSEIEIMLLFDHQRQKDHGGPLD